MKRERARKCSSFSLMFNLRSVWAQTGHGETNAKGSANTADGNGCPGVSECKAKVNLLPLINCLCCALILWDVRRALEWITAFCLCWDWLLSFVKWRHVSQQEVIHRTFSWKEEKSVYANAGLPAISGCPHNRTPTPTGMLMHRLPDTRKGYYVSGLFPPCFCFSAHYRKGS